MERHEEDLLGTVQVQYTAGHHSDAYNHWKTKSTETRPDGSRRIVFTNYIGQVLINELTDDSDSWIEYRRFDDDGREILRAEPSAMIGYDDSTADLNVSLRPTAGLIRLTADDLRGRGRSKGTEVVLRLAPG